MNLFGVLCSDFQSADEGSLGLLCGADRLVEGVPPDDTLLPAVSYNLELEGCQGLLTVIVWADEPRQIQARVRHVFQAALVPNMTVRYVTSGPIRYDDRLRSRFQRASYLVKIRKPQKLS